jgi:hypothetical protein
MPEKEKWEEDVANSPKVAAEAALQTAKDVGKALGSLLGGARRGMGRMVSRRSSGQGALVLLIDDRAQAQEVWRNRSGIDDDRLARALDVRRIRAEREALVDQAKAEMEARSQGRRGIGPVESVRSAFRGADTPELVAKRVGSIGDKDLATVAKGRMGDVSKGGRSALMEGRGFRMGILAQALDSNPAPVFGRGGPVSVAKGPSRGPDLGVAAMMKGMGGNGL